MLSYKALSDLVKVSKKCNLGFGVNVYDNGKLLEGSPFSSYTQAALPLGGECQYFFRYLSKNRYWQAL